MIYKGKRIKAELRNQGGGKYLLVIPFDESNYKEEFVKSWSNADRYHYLSWANVVSTFWAGVKTADLKEKWKARFFQQIISCDQLDTGEMRIQDVGGKPCSFNSMPKVWQELYAPVLDKVLEGKYWN